MKMQKLVIPGMLTFLLSTIVAVILVNQAAVASPSVEEFFRVRELVHDTLYKRVITPIEGVTVKLPVNEKQLERIGNPFPAEAHIQTVARRQDWSGNGGFQLVLELDDSLLLAANQGNSETMTATVLLDHYFSDLENAGFRHQGTPNVVVGRTQSAANEWFKEHDRSVVVSGTVFVSPESKQAIVMGTVREWLPKQP